MYVSTYANNIRHKPILLKIQSSNVLNLVKWNLLLDRNIPQSNSISQTDKKQS